MINHTQQPWRILPLPTAHTYTSTGDLGHLCGALPGPLACCKPTGQTFHVSSQFRGNLQKGKEENPMGHWQREEQSADLDNHTSDQMPGAGQHGEGCQTCPHASL